MFEKLAKIRQLQAWRDVPGFRQAKPANDNRACDHGPRKARTRLVCRWSRIEGSNRLACHWEIENPEGLTDSPGPPGARIHKTFFRPSYQPNVGGSGSA